MFGAAYTYLGFEDSMDVRTEWHNRDGVFYTTRFGYEPRRLYTRIYNVKRILDRHPNIVPPKDDRIPNSTIYYDGSPNRLEDIIEQQESGLFQRTPNRGGNGEPAIGESRASFFDNSFIITATAPEHRVIEDLLRKLDQ